MSQPDLDKKLQNERQRLAREQPRKWQEMPPKTLPADRFGGGWRNFIRATETSVVIALWIGAMTSSDLVIAVILLSCGCAVGLLAIYLDPVRSRGRKSVLSSILTVIFIGSGWLINFRHQEPVPPYLFQSQLDEINALETFIGSKSEMDLREIFDFPSMFLINVRMTKARLEANERTKTNVFDMTPYLKNGSMCTLMQKLLAAVLVGLREDSRITRTQAKSP
ncbi:hypothetical protein ACTGJ9_022355 [Bradyrhizobium sp. RDM12]